MGIPATATADIAFSSFSLGMETVDQPLSLMFALFLAKIAYLLFFMQFPR